MPLRPGDEDGVLPPASKRRSRRILDTSTAYPQLDSPLGFPRTWRSGPHRRDTWRRAGLTGSAPLTRPSAPCSNSTAISASCPTPSANRLMPPKPLRLIR